MRLPLALLLGVTACAHAAAPRYALDCDAGLTPRVHESPLGRSAWCEDREHRRQGPFQAWHADGAVWIEASYRDDRAEGRWIEHDVDGSVLFDGTYRDGAVDGAWRSLRADGTEKAHGTNRGGRLEGDVEARSRDGKTRYVRSYRDNRPHGRWALYENDVLVWEGTYEDGALVTERTVEAAP
jgi:antitoxin component YwqK of YwqJK toxin-antitoxin module